MTVRVAVVPLSTIAKNGFDLRPSAYIVNGARLAQQEAAAHRFIQQGETGLRLAAEERARVEAFQKANGIQELPL